MNFTLAIVNCAQCSFDMSAKWAEGNRRENKICVKLGYSTMCPIDFQVYALCIIKTYRFGMMHDV